jgi:hypothetical protein
MRTWFWGWAAVLALGCSSSVDDQGGPCSQRSGTYLTQYEERSGNCGPIPEQLQTITEQPTMPEAPCTGAIDYSEDNCSVTSSVVCPEDGLGAGWTSTVELKADWNESGSAGTAIVQFVVKDGAGGIVCQSTYNVTITKQ